MLAGDPLLLDNAAGEPRDRSQDLATLHRALAAGDDAALARTSGTFCGVHVDKRSGTLRLFTDKLGVRPIYYWIGPDFVVYASAMRIIEALPLIPKAFDIRGVSDIACFGFPLAHRTPYLDVATLRAGEVVRVQGAQVSHHEYWRWDEVPAPAANGASLERQVGDAFMSAVRRRLGDEADTVAFLSGGLDSRSIVAALRALGATVHSINFSPDRTQDEVFGREAARVLQTSHHHLAKRAASVTRKDQVYNQDEVNRWFDTQKAAGTLTGRRRIVWSGDGGSVGLGHVYLTERIVDLAQRGQTEAAIAAFLDHNKIRAARKLFRSTVRDQLAAFPSDGLRDELALLPRAEPGRAFHLFLMLNDQRRHLVHLYEHIDLGRLEFHLPFFDSEFLSLIIGSPVRPFLLHRFYLSWLQAVLPQAVTVPWQAYPGHVPCPLPAPQDLGYQWGDYYSRATQDHMKRHALEKAHRVLGSPHFPHQLLDGTRLRIATWLTRFGAGDYGYVIDAAERYTEYWGQCQRAGESAR
nr:asparagine synthase-related protein [Aquabacterium terrae]